MIENSEGSARAELCVEDVLSAAAEYIEICKEEGSGTKKGGRFPNLAGLCRYLGISLEKLGEILGESPSGYGVLAAVFEDEALNSDLSATVISAYLKQRLGYGEKEGAKHASMELPQVKLVFDHDIFEDGG